MGEEKRINNFVYGYRRNRAIIYAITIQQHFFLICMRIRRICNQQLEVFVKTILIVKFALTTDSDETTVLLN